MCSLRNSTTNLIALFFFAMISMALASSALSAEPDGVRAMVATYCATCHDAESAKGGLNLTAILADDAGHHPEIWEKVVRKLTARQMPPLGKDRPTDDGYISAVHELETALDAASADHPNPGRTDTIRRLTRTEYQ